MKIFITALCFTVIGYFLYPVINPPERKGDMELLLRNLFEDEARRYAEADSAEKKLHAADALYEKMMLIFLSQLSLKGPENTPLKEVTIHSTSGPVVYVQSSVPAPRVIEKKDSTLSERISHNLLTGKDVIRFASFMGIDASDSRLKKLFGASIGKLKLKQPSRTGMDESLSLVVDAKTKLEAQDSYDNVTINYTAETGLAFKGVPGDENILMMTLPEYFVFIDLRNFPAFEGKVYRGQNLVGDFILHKK